MKTKIKNKIKRMFFGNILKQSQNYLPFTPREKVMIKWFVKFQLTMILIIIAWVNPINAIIGHISDFKSLKALEDKVIVQPVNAQESAPQPEKTPFQVSSGVIREVSMYTSTPEQTDSSPCIGASGQDQCVLWAKGQNICASNAFPIGSVLKVDKLGECLVIDRMNKRYSNRIDWYAGYDEECLDGVNKGDYCPNYERAVKFGVQNLLVDKL